MVGKTFNMTTTDSEITGDMKITAPEGANYMGD